MSLEILFQKYFDLAMNSKEKKIDWIRKGLDLEERQKMFFFQKMMKLIYLEDVIKQERLEAMGVYSGYNQIYIE